MLELNQCYNMDCMKGMAQFPDGFFDLAVVDPPYFSGPERRGYYGSKVSKIGVYRDYPVSPVWEIPGRAYFDELRRVAKHYIVWGCNYFSYEFAPGRIVWDKCKKGTSFSDCELAARQERCRGAYHAGKQKAERAENPPDAKAGSAV